MASRRTLIFETSMRLPTVLLNVAALLSLSSMAQALVTIDNVSLSGTVTAGDNSDGFTFPMLTNSFLHASTSDQNGLAGDALASIVLDNHLIVLEGGEDTRIDFLAGVLAQAVGTDPAGTPFTADASVSAVVDFTLDRDHWIEFGGDSYFDAVRRTSDNDRIDLTTATLLAAGSYEIVITEGATATDSKVISGGLFNLRLYTIPEPTSLAMGAASLLGLAGCGRKAVTNSGRGGGDNRVRRRS